MLRLPDMVPAALKARLYGPSAGYRTTPDAYEPAHVEYLMVLSPTLSEHLGAEDPARLTTQILFYTGSGSTVSAEQTVRNVALANALVEFGSAMHERQYAASAALRRVSADSEARRLLFVEVQSGYWIHAVC